MIPRKNEEIRLCGDYRALTKQTIADRYPIPIIHEFTDDMKDTTFLKIDLSGAYHHVLVPQEGIRRTAVANPFG